MKNLNCVTNTSSINSNELITDLLLTADTLEYREVLTDVYVNIINSDDISSDYRDRISNVYLGIMSFINSIDKIKNGKVEMKLN